jgi:hypothetical protein
MKTLSFCLAGILTFSLSASSFGSDEPTIINFDEFVNAGPELIMAGAHYAAKGVSFASGEIPNAVAVGQTILFSNSTQQFIIAQTGSAVSGPNLAANVDGNFNGPRNDVLMTFGPSVESVTLTLDDAGESADIVRLLRLVPTQTPNEFTIVEIAEGSDDAQGPAARLSVGGPGESFSYVLFQIIGPDGEGFDDLTFRFATPPSDFDGDGIADAIDDDDDNDGLADSDEADLGTDQFNPDSDTDGLLDGTEVTIQTDPLDSDTDNDGLTDGFEVSIGTDPSAADTDGDGVPDAIDPTPTTPGVPASYVEASLRTLCERIRNLDLSLFDAKNDNARSGQRNALANKVCAAANAVRDGLFAEAADKLQQDVMSKLDGAPSPPDFMRDTLDKVELRTDLLLILSLLNELF